MTTATSTTSELSQISTAEVGFDQLKMLLTTANTAIGAVDEAQNSDRSASRRDEIENNAALEEKDN